MNRVLPSAVLWDMDGTLVDSEPYWVEAQTALVEGFGGTWTSEEALALVGTGLWVGAEILREKGVPWDADRIVTHLSDEVADRIRQRVPWRPGARELLRRVSEAGIPNALVTMSLHPTAALVAERVEQELGTGRPAFATLVTGDQVAEPKPHPEAYLTAARRLGIEITRAVAIEDSPTGLASAVASGAVSIAVPHILPIDEGSAYTVWPTLENATLDDLVRVLGERAAQEREVSA